MFGYGNSINTSNNTTEKRGLFEHSQIKYTSALLNEEMRHLLLPHICTSASHVILLTAWAAPAFYLFLQPQQALSFTAILSGLLNCYWNQTAGEHTETTANCTNPQHGRGKPTLPARQLWVARHLRWPQCEQYEVSLQGSSLLQWQHSQRRLASG